MRRCSGSVLRTHRGSLGTHRTRSDGRGVPWKPGRASGLLRGGAKRNPPGWEGWCRRAMRQEAKRPRMLRRTKRGVQRREGHARLGVRRKKARRAGAAGGLSRRSNAIPCCSAKGHMSSAARVMPGWAFKGQEKARRRQRGPAMVNARVHGLWKHNTRQARPATPLRALVHDPMAMRAAAAAPAAAGAAPRCRRRILPRPRSGTPPRAAPGSPPGAPSRRQGRKRHKR